jgi:ABC-type Fe3+-hydroxamate transport system substrate-binding protein
MAAIHRAGVKVLVLPFAALADIPCNTRRIGEFLGAPVEAEALARAFDEALSALPALPARRAAYILWWSPPVTAGPSSFIGEGLRRLGLEPGPSARTAFPTVSFEELLAWAPSLILYPADAGPPPAWLAARAGVRFIEVPADRWNRPALNFPAALADLARALGD